MRSKKKNSKLQINLKQLISVIFIIILLIFIKYLELKNDNKPLKTALNNTVNETYTNIQIKDIPKYSGEIVIDINNNVPYFEDKDLTTENFEYYSPLDEFNRAGQAFANICKYTMPPEGTKRGSISYKPTGWNQYMYGESNQYHLYERCHLIAWQLGNENNNKQNLITGTSQMNTAMIEYENIIANWVKQKNNQGKDYHVLYRVTPIYDNENKLASGIEIEAKSVEEEGVSYNKFIYNIQDNFEIDYTNGKSILLK